MVGSGQDVSLDGIRTPELSDLRWPSPINGLRAAGSDLVSVAWRGTRDQPATMTNARFDNCVIDPFDLDWAVLSGCEFGRVRFGLLTVGGIHDSILEDCTFRACRLGELYINRSRFERCTFSSVASGTVSFENATLIDVSFAGRPGLLEFDQCRFDGVDLSAANPKRLELRRPARGSRALLFDRPDHFVIRDVDLPQLLPMARSAVSPSAFADFEIFASAFGPRTRRERLSAFAPAPTYLDVRPADIVRESTTTAAERAILVDLVRQQRVRTLEVA
jgi:uncharacterized protein YjbI with pentapeptide repeats